ncbi:Asp23/Gls24 family envelope stress response protein [Caldanaerobius polysaccharolyticus]|uniref:Asp23/Gls24 family envelope stress response protein n=1 Tax=Caldanaerobius polysaccharolyticus TaxID=44256 RepID=UPI00047D90A4|nr:Asp23/Gls24 family envelope stress response protein [Caldanaerobius polysaccharolyticus]
MIVYALVGPSGSGKSYKSLQVAGARGIEAIIDDGLLIMGNKVVAGKSAKKELTKVAAIKTALFVDERHARAVKQALEAKHINSVLILGTSDGMVCKIAERLGLPPVSEIIRIEDVSKPWEIKKAQSNRTLNGTHVIPVPTFEIKDSFSGFFMDPLKILRRVGHKNVVIEKTLVRPHYSYMGKYEIADTAIMSLVSHEALKVDGVAKTRRVEIKKGEDGIILTVDVIVKYGRRIQDIVLGIQKNVKTQIEYMTAINVLRVNVQIKGIDVNSIVRNRNS